jgi:uncharacterized damage-inducible protein DinB
MIEDLVRTWEISNRVTLRLLGVLTPEGLQATLSTRGGRTVGQQLAHVLAVRRDKLERADRSLVTGVPVVTREQGHDGELLVAAFERSGEAVAELIRRSAAAGGTVKGFRRGIVVLVGYLIAHEAHHRGHLLLTLKQCRIRRSPLIQMGLWEWNRL